MGFPDQIQEKRCSEKGRYNADRQFLRGYSHTGYDVGSDKKCPAHQNRGWNQTFVFRPHNGSGNMRNRQPHKTNSSADGNDNTREKCRQDNDPHFQSLCIYTDSDRHVVSQKQDVKSFREKENEDQTDYKSNRRIFQFFPGGTA